VLSEKDVIIILDERHYKAIECKATGGNITDIAKASGVSRNTIYKWVELEEFKAEVGRREQEFITASIAMVASYAPTNIKGIQYLAEHAVSEKVRLDARLALLNKTVPNTTKLTLDDTREDSTVNMDVLDGVMDAEDVTG